MTNPTSRLTKFRLQLEEYDFDVHYIKGKDNVTADALSRIEITSEDLKGLAQKSDSSVNVMTRAQEKKASNASTEVANDSQNDRIDHPGVVEILKPPVECVELRIIDEPDSKTKQGSRNVSRNVHYNNNLEKSNDFIVLNKLKYDRKNSIIYICKETRSPFVLRTTLRDLQKICTQYNIPELIIIKNDNNSSVLKELVKSLNEVKLAKLKINVIRNIQKVYNKETRQLILNDFHMLPTGGHAGIQRMYNNIKRYYFWSGLYNDVKDFVKRCDDCQRYKHSNVAKQPLCITTTATSAFQKVFLDLVGPLPVDHENNRYILTIQCDLSKFIECFPLPDKESETVAKCFVEKFILRYGVCQEVVSDRGKEFVAEIFQKTCHFLQINTVNATAYHHETLGALENTHKHLGAFLRMQVSTQPDTWSSWIPHWCFAFNNTVHSETQYTPYELVFGKTAIIPSNININVEPIYNFESYPNELKYRLQVAWNDARNNLLVSKNLRKVKYDRDKYIKQINYKIGDKVLVKNESRSNKLESIFKGPYEVIYSNNDSPNVTIRVDNKDVEIHKNRVKLYNG